MRIASGSTWAQFSESLREFLDRRCFLLNNRLLCRDCGASIVHSRVVVSICDPSLSGCLVGVRQQSLEYDSALLSTVRRKA
jgi:hypothetical protein